MAFSLRTSIVDKTFDTSNDSYKLSLEIGFDRLTFSILDSERNKYLVLENYEIKNCLNYNQLINDFESVYNENQKLQLQFTNVTIGLLINSAIQIPKPLFDLESLATQLEFHKIINKGEFAVSDFLKSVDGFTGYAASKELKNVLLKKFTGAKIFHYSSSLIECLLANHKNDSGVLSFIQVQFDCFDLIIIKDGKLEFYNCFEYKTGEDLIYYLLFAFEQLKLNPENTPLKIMGFLEKQSQIYSLIYRYIRNVEFMKKSNSFEYSFTFNDIPEHYYFNLLNQQGCEL